MRINLRLQRVGVEGESAFVEIIFQAARHDHHGHIFVHTHLAARAKLDAANEISRWLALLQFPRLILNLPVYGITRAAAICVRQALQTRPFRDFVGRRECA